VQNLITRVNFKVRTIMSREGREAKTVPRAWADVDPRNQVALKQMMEPLVRAMFFVDAAPLAGQVVTSSGFSERFAQRGPHDPQARSLRDLQLNKRLFRYPLSYMIYTESYTALPGYAREYVDSRIVEVLQGRDTTGLSDKLSAEDRAAIGGILAATLPRFAAPLGQRVAAR
jgi:hypothetical protein